MWLLDWVAVGVDFVDFADVQFADAGFDFAHVADYHPDKWSGWMYFLAISLAIGGRYGQDFLGEGVVVILRQTVLEDVAVGAGELLHGFECAGKSERGVGLLVLEFGVGDGLAANDVFVFRR